MASLSTEALERLQVHGQDIPWLLDQWAARRPDHPALVWDPPSGSRGQWTYRQLRDDVWRLAAGLSKRGVARGDKVLYTRTTARNWWWRGWPAPRWEPWG